jgi:hypothetical protein
MLHRGLMSQLNTTRSGGSKARIRAFKLLRDYGRNSNQRLTDGARDVVTAASADFPPLAGISYMAVLPD